MNKKLHKLQRGSNNISDIGIFVSLEKGQAVMLDGMAEWNSSIHAKFDRTLDTSHDHRNLNFIKFSLHESEYKHTCTIFHFSVVVLLVLPFYISTFGTFITMKNGGSEQISIAQVRVS